MSNVLRHRVAKALAVTVVAATVIVGLGACTNNAPQAESPDIPAGQQHSIPRGVVDGAFQLGSGPVTVDVFTDAFCPHCTHFDAATSHELRSRIDAGDITLRLHPMNYVSGKRADATDFSTRVMNLLAAIADDGQLARIPEVYSAVLAAQPMDISTQVPDNDRLLELAAQSGVAVTASIRDAVDTGRWNAWVQGVNDQALGRIVDDTGARLQFVPTVVVAGRQLEIREDGGDLRRLQEAISDGRQG